MSETVQDRTIVTVISEDRVIIAGVVLTWYQRVTDGQTDWQTVRQNLP